MGRMVWPSQQEVYEKFGLEEFHDNSIVVSMVKCKIVFGVIRRRCLKFGAKIP